LASVALELDGTWFSLSVKALRAKKLHQRLTESAAEKKAVEFQMTVTFPWEGGLCV
jgi:hypothetical protein